jgi:hypothetical protein
VKVASIYILSTYEFKMINFSFADSSTCELEFTDQVATFEKFGRLHLIKHDTLQSIYHIPIG